MGAFGLEWWWILHTAPAEPDRPSVQTQMDRTKIERERGSLLDERAVTSQTLVIPLLRP